MHKQILSVTPSGTTGSATGSTTVTLQRGYELHGVYIDYTSVTSDTIARLELVDPAANILTISSANTDGWYFPRLYFSTSTGATYSSAMGMARYPLVGQLVARASTSTPTTNGVEFHVYVVDV